MIVLRNICKSLYAPLAVILILSSCTVTVNNDKEQMEQWKEEVRKAENDFAAMAASDGLASAFEHFAADEAVIKRRGELIKGKVAIGEWYRDNPYSAGEEELSWDPDFIEVSSSGDLAYTYGGFTNTRTDSLGQVSTSEGIFHTVWQRQKDGSWKYVWD